MRSAEAPQGVPRAEVMLDVDMSAEADDVENIADDVVRIGAVFVPCAAWVRTQPAARMWACAIVHAGCRAARLE